MEFNEEVREWTRRYASKTREEWKSTLLEGKDWDEDEDNEDEDDDMGDGDDNEDDNMKY